MSYFTKTISLPDGATARGEAIENEFTAVETGFGLAETAVGKALRFSSAIGELAANATARAERVLAFDGAGNPIVRYPADAIDDGVTSAAFAWSSSKVSAVVNALIDDAATATTTTWSSTKINAALGALLNDAVTGGTSTWSSNKIQAEITAAAGATIDDAVTSVTQTWSSNKISAAIAALIDDAATATTTVWSASKTDAAIAAQVGALIDDAVTSASQVWSSSKVNAQIGTLINDGATASGTTWSSTKIDSALAALINDAVQGAASTWSSDKVAAEIAAGAGTTINDGATNTTQTWSSNKIASEIAAGAGVTIDDGASNTTQTWSSNKINAQIDADVAALIDDASTATTKAWSASRLTTQLGLKAALAGATFTGTVTAPKFTTDTTTLDEFPADSRTDITGKTGGSTFGSILQGASSGHIAVELRANDANDTFGVFANYNAGTYAAGVSDMWFAVRASGLTTFNGPATFNAALSANASLTFNDLNEGLILAGGGQLYDTATSATRTVLRGYGDRLDILNQAGSQQIAVFAASAITLSKAATASSTLTVAGAATLQSTLAVTGAATLNSTLTVAGAVDAPDVETDYLQSRAGLSAVQMTDTWLRLNPGVAFTSGIYCGSSLLRTDGSFQVGASGAYAYFSASSQKLKHPVFQSEYDNGSSGSAKTITWANGNRQKLTVSASTTLSFGSPAGPCNLLLRAVMNGNYAITWPTAVKWPDGTAPSPSTSAGDVDLYSFYFDGTSYWGAQIADLS